MSERPKNAKGTTPPVPARDVNAAARAQVALRLRAQHLTWDEIAAQAGYGSRGAAHNAVKRELDRCLTHDVKAMRDEECYALEQLQGRCFKAATDESNSGWTWAVDRFVALSKRKSELMGLDTPIDSAGSANLVIVREVPRGYLGNPPAVEAQP